MVKIDHIVSLYPVRVPSSSLSTVWLVPAKPVKSSVFQRAVFLLHQAMSE